MIKRSKHTTDYTVIPNAIIEDKDLDCECLGMLTYLIGKPSNWKIQAEFLGKRFGWGKTKVYGILKKLIDAGYVTRKANIVNGLKRGSEYTVYDTKMGEKPHCSRTRTSETPIVREGERIISNNNLSYIYKEKIYKKESEEFLKQFEEFRKYYPRWVGTIADVKKALKVALTKIEFEKLLTLVKAYKRLNREEQFYRHPARWLAKEEWNDSSLTPKVIEFVPKQDDDFVLTQWKNSDSWFRGRLKRNHDQTLRTLIADGKISQKEYDSAKEE